MGYGFWKLQVLCPVKFSFATLAKLNTTSLPQASVIWKSKGPSKVKAFTESVNNKKINSNNLLWVQGLIKPPAQSIVPSAWWLGKLWTIFSPFPFFFFSFFFYDRQKSNKLSACKKRPHKVHTEYTSPLQSKKTRKENKKMASPY